MECDYKTSYGAYGVKRGTYRRKSAEDPVIVRIRNT